MDASIPISLTRVDGPRPLPCGRGGDVACRLRPFEGMKTLVRRFRSTIAARLLLWCLLLTAGFSAAVASGLFAVRDLERLAQGAARGNFVVEATLKRAGARLLAYEENRGRFEILGDPALTAAARAEYAEFERLIRWLTGWVGAESPLRGHLSEYAQAASGAGDDPAKTPPERIRALIAGLQTLRQENLRELEERLIQLEQTSGRALDRGVLFAVLAGGAALLGSLWLARGLNRRIKQLKSGVEAVSLGRTPPPLAMPETDELGELGAAFDAMGSRLAEEEGLRSDFIAMLSHEIKTPLTAVREAVSLTADGSLGALNPEQKRFLDLAEGESRRLTDLLARLLTVSKLSGAHCEARPVPVDLAALVKEAVETIGPQARQSGARIVYEGPETAPVAADPGLLAQALGNVLSNAVKYGGPGLVRVRLVDEGSALFVSVEDSGPGVAPGDEDKVFRKYWRGEGAAKGVDGAGLGLFAARQAVLAQGGELFVHRPASGGAGFGLRLFKTGKGR